jgi:hypothetical protein
MLHFAAGIWHQWIETPMMFKFVQLRDVLAIEVSGIKEPLT